MVRGAFIFRVKTTEGFRKRGDIQEFVTNKLNIYI